MWKTVKSPSELKVGDMVRYHGRAIGFGYGNETCVVESIDPFSVVDVKSKTLTENFDYWQTFEVYVEDKEETK